MKKIKTFSEYFFLPNTAASLLHDRINIFEHIKKKHGQDIYGAARNLEDLIKKHTKIQLDIYFIKPCIKENLIPNFAKVNVAIKHGTHGTHGDRNAKQTWPKED